MNFSWPAWVLVICAVAGLVCVLYGAIRALGALRTVRRGVDRLRSAPVIARAAHAGADVARINADLGAMQELLTRANAAIARVNDGLTDLRIPQAVAAVRTASAAVRLLVSGR